MHEMSLAMSVMDIAQREMARAGKSRLTGLEIEIGSQAGVERSTFITALDAVTRSMVGSRVRIDIVDVEATAQCLQCETRFSPRSFGGGTCPNCGSGQTLIVAGREFRLRSLTCE